MRRTHTQRDSVTDGRRATQYLFRWLSDGEAEMEMGQCVMGHGSNGSPFLDGSRGSWVTASDMGHSQ